jgi:hypothetical protein
VHAEGSGKALRTPLAAFFTVSPKKMARYPVVVQALNNYTTTLNLVFLDTNNNPRGKYHEDDLVSYYRART